MAEKGWTSRAAVAAGAAAGTGAAQLGLGYGLGVVVWPVAATPDDSAWLGSLGWATWIAASATVFGAVIGSRLGGPPARRRGLWRLTLAASAGVGALVAVALIALPARSAVRMDTFSPQVIAGGYALFGVVVGVLLAYWAVTSRPVTANLIATAVWLWSLAIAAIIVELTAHRAAATYLTSWQFAESVDGVRYGTIYWPSGLLTLAAAFLVGVVAAAPAARRGDLGVGAATSGVAGPLLVAAAFLALAPQLTNTLGPLASAYLIAPYAILAGLAGSALAVTAGRALADRRAEAAHIGADRTGAAGHDSTDDRGPGIRSAADHGTVEEAAGAAVPDHEPPGFRRRLRSVGRGTAGSGRDSGPDSAGTGRGPADEPPAVDAGVAAVPASDPFLAPVSATPKVKAPNPTGRAKLPAPTSSDLGSGQIGEAQSGPEVKGTADTRGGARSRGGSGAPRADGGTARPRPRKATEPATDGDRTKSTVTPPPAAPTVARINPPANG
jgi:MFS family permease